MKQAISAFMIFAATAATVLGQQAWDRSVMMSQQYELRDRTNIISSNLLATVGQDLSGVPSNTTVVGLQGYAIPAPAGVGDTGKSYSWDGAAWELVAGGGGGGDFTNMWDYPQWTNDFNLFTTGTYSSLTGDYNVVIGGEGNQLDGHDTANNVMLGGENLRIGGGLNTGDDVKHNALIAGDGNVIVVVDDDAIYNSILAGANNTIGNDTYMCSIIGSEDSIIDVYGYGNIIFGGDRAKIYDCEESIMGGVSSATITNVNFAGMFAVSGGLIKHDGRYNFMASVNNGTIRHSNPAGDMSFSMMLNGRGSLISNCVGSAAIGSYATVTSDYSYVWSDSDSVTPEPYADHGTNTYNVRARGGHHHDGGPVYANGFSALEVVNDRSWMIGAALSDYNSMTGDWNVILGGRYNSMNGFDVDYNFIGCGEDNIIGGGLSTSDDVHHNAIIGGEGNRITSTDDDVEYSVILGGVYNTIGDETYMCAIMGSEDSVIDKYGYGNTVFASDRGKIYNADECVIGGALRSTITNANFGVIFASSEALMDHNGYYNLMAATRDGTIKHSNPAGDMSYSMMLNGRGSLISNCVGSAAIGSYATVTSDYSFVWSDSDSLVPAPYADHGTNTFNVRARGGHYHDGGTTYVEDVTGMLGTEAINWYTMTNYVATASAIPSLAQVTAVGSNTTESLSLRGLWNSISQMSGGSEFWDEPTAGLNLGYVKSGTRTNRGTANINMGMVSGVDGVQTFIGSGGSGSINGGRAVGVQSIDSSHGSMNYGDITVGNFQTIDGVSGSLNWGLGNQYNSGLGSLTFGENLTNTHDYSYVFGKNLVSQETNSMTARRYYSMDDATSGTQVVNFQTMVADRAKCEQSMANGNTQIFTDAGGYVPITNWTENITDTGYTRTHSNMTTSVSDRYEVYLYVSYATATDSDFTCRFYTNNVVATDNGGNIIGWRRDITNADDDDSVAMVRTLDIAANVDCDWRIDAVADETVTWDSGTFGMKRD